jgi:hypothetical protein
MLSQFALSRKMQLLLDEATKSSTDAVSKLQLGTSVTQIDVNLRIHENVSVLMR